MYSGIGLTRMGAFFRILSISLVVFLSFDSSLKAQKEGAQVEEAETSASTPAAKTSPVLATTDGEYPDIRVEVTELKRGSGGTLTLKFAIINDSSKNMDFGYEFGDFNTISNTYLIDAVGKKKYLVLRDTEGKCICSSGLKSVEPGSRINLYAKFPAPPDSVEKIGVIIPHFIPMDDVPIGK